MLIYTAPEGKAGSCQEMLSNSVHYWGSYHSPTIGGCRVTEDHGKS